MSELSKKTVSDLTQILRTDFDNNAGFMTANKWVRIARELGLNELVKELEQDIKQLENAI
jgi:hypothetical protein